MGKFRTQFDAPTRFISQSGSKEIMDYEKRLDSAGRTVVNKKGLKNIYDRIQAHKDEDIKTMIKRLTKQEQKQFQTLKDVYKADGDVYDLRDMPTSMAQAMQMSIDGKKKFEQLPMEIKQEFNNNYMEFHSMIKNDNKKFEEKVGKYLKPEPKIETTPVQTTTPTQTTPVQENTTKETL